MGNVFFGGGKVGMKTPINLPSGYTRLEYIESTGTQWIDTGFKYTKETGAVKVKYMPKSIGGLYYTYRLGGSYNGSNRSFILYGGYNPKYCGLGGVDVSMEGITCESNILYEDTCVITTAGKYTYTSVLNGNITRENTGSYSGTIATGKNYYIFCNNENGSAAWFGNFRVYSYQLYEAGIIVRDFLPCINASGEIGLFDLVGNQFYGNAGSGTFIGSEVV